ncbi:response regulator [Desulfopila sp. IMCC35008]|uniref:response regulator n=1 Tax=Desulfopila sp. IMCC35008 TaxID=2653858 RepID=UPI0013D379F4|nr:response regulator [Desulfopila sp. IMCC35008]
MIFGSLVIIATILFLLNRRLQREILARKQAEDALLKSELKLQNYFRQTEQFSLSAAAMLTIQDEKQLFSEISNAIVEHSDFKRVLISLFRNEPPYRELIGYAGVSDEILDKVRKTDLAKNWYDNVFSLGIKIGNFSYYIPYTLSHILNQQATIYGEEAKPADEHLWHPKDNLFVRMNDENGKFLGIISVDTSKSGLKPTAEIVRPLEIYASLISQIIILRREYSRRTELEHQLRHSQKMEALGNLTGGIAHDFNNILGIIIGNAELALIDTPDWNPANQNVHEIKTAGLRAKEIIQQLISFSRKSSKELRAIQISPLIGDTVKLLRSTLPANITLHYENNTDNCVIAADPPLIYQLLHNLCTNGVQAIGSAKGTLTVTVTDQDISSVEGEQQETKPGTYIKLTVRDSGQGIAAHQLNKIFDPYFTTRGPGEGSGLGLTTVHGIVQSHDGFVTVTSKPGEGSEFVVYLPCIQKEAELNDQPAPALSSNQVKNILVIDDEPSLLAVNKSVLERCGYSVFAQETPLSALELFKKCDPGTFDLVITDLTMPEMNGMDLAKQIHESDSSIPIFLCTGYSDKLKQKEMAQYGIVNVFTKPLDTASFTREVQKLLS